MKAHYVFLLLAACAADPTDENGPPRVDDSESLAAGKADGLSLGTTTVQGQQSSYRSTLDGMTSWCTPGGKVSFDVEYVNHSLPWGVKLSLWRGMQTEDWCGGCEPAYDYVTEWADHQVVEMKPSAGWTWRAHTESFGYGSGAGGKFLALRYVMRIEMPDGSIKWDNGGSSVGFYQALAPDGKCDPSWPAYETRDAPMEPIPVSIIYR